MNAPLRLLNNRRQRDTRATTALSQQIARLAWLVPLLSFALVIAHQVVEFFWLHDASEFHFLADTLVYGMLGPVIVWFALGWIKRRVMLKEKAENELVHAHAELTSLNHRISFLLNVNQRLAQAPDEDALAQLSLQLLGEATPSLVGSAMIRFDDQHQPMPIEYRGTLEENILTKWHAHLSSRSVKQRCASCQLFAAQRGQDCPALEYLPLNDVSGVVCLTLERNHREFGILGMFLSADAALTEEEKNLLDAITAEISTAFENIRLRTRELTTFHDITEALQLRLDLNGLMNRILNLTMETSNADAGLLVLKESDGTLTPYATAGTLTPALPRETGEGEGWGWLPLVESLIARAMKDASAEPLVATVRGKSGNPISVLCAPMVTDKSAIGAIALMSRQPESVLGRQTRVVAVIAGQAALLAQNARLYAQLENQAILAERGRLAREMHDGLAQTLGYLKMRARQIARWVDAGQTEQAEDALQSLADTADDAYLDLRAAIDGLRLTLDDQPGADFSSRLNRCVASYERQSAQQVELNIDSRAGSALALSAQAHLLGIVQEALTNIRKHANADRVTLTLSAADNQIQLVIQDNGRGFNASSAQADAHHGLRLMRERADLLGADLQITSAPGKGTRVCVELSLQRVAPNG